MRHINPFKAGASVGTLLGLWHFAWATVVFAGWAQPLMDFVLRLHFIEMDFAIAPFAFDTAALLVGVTAAIGYLFGSVFALVWNWLAVPAGDPRGKVAQA